MKNIVRKEIPMGSKTLVLETGKIARQATASVIASMGGTVVMCAVVTKPSAEGRDFFPLSVHYMEKTYACLLYTSPSPRDSGQSRMPSSA